MSNSTRFAGDDYDRTEWERMRKANEVTQEQRNQTQDILRELARLVNVWQNGRILESLDARKLHEKIGEVEEVVTRVAEICKTLRNGFTTDQRISFGELLEEIEADRLFDANGKLKAKAK